MLKKYSIGFYVTVVTILCAIMAVVFYIWNCHTDYFSRVGGVNQKLVASLIVASVLLIIYLATDITGKLPAKVLDYIPMLAGIFFMLGLVIFFNERLYYAATIMSFEKSDANMADLSSAFIGMGFCIAAVILNIIGSFLTVVRKEF